MIFFDLDETLFDHDFADKSLVDLRLN